MCFPSWRGWTTARHRFQPFMRPVRQSARQKQADRHVILASAAMVGAGLGQLALTANESVPTRIRLEAQIASRLNQLRDTNFSPR